MGERLSEREEAILFGLLATYIKTHEPVGSRTLADEVPERLSPATIRNILARLETMGYLSQPHASAGRVPTDLSYRYLARRIVAHLQGEDEPAPDAVEALVRGGSLNAVARHLTTLLADSAHTVGFAVTPPLEVVKLRCCDLVSMGDSRVLCVVVSEVGQVHEKVLWPDRMYDPEQLRWFSNYLNETYAGLSFWEIRRRLRAAVEDESTRCHHRVMEAVRLVSPYFLAEGPPRDLFWEGATWLVEGLQSGEDLAGARRLLESLEKKTRLLDFLEDLLGDGRPVQVVIGDDWPDPEVHTLAMVAAPFGDEAKGLGCVGVIGPKPLSYERVIPTVRRAARLATLASSKL